MISASVTLLAVSLVFMLCVQARKHMPLASNYSIFIFFSLLYSVFPILTYYGIEPKVWFFHGSLNESELLVSTQIIIMSACNVVFASVFWAKHQRTDVQPVFLPSVDKKHVRDVVFLGYTVACLVLAVLGHKYNYTSGRGELIHSFISNAKVLLASSYIVFMVVYGFGYRLTLMFLGFLLLTLVEQSRWYFISILVATILYAQHSRALNGKKVAVVGIIFAAILAYIGLYRCGVSLQHFSLLLNPFFMEGDFGSYVVLQTYDLVYSGAATFYTLFSDYLVDPILYLIPRIFFMGLGIDKDSVGMLATFVSVHQPYLHELYAPLGGFHYIAQASSAVPFLGPVIVTYAFALLTVAVENRRRRSIVAELTYYLYSAGFMFVFIKTKFDLTVKYYLTLAIPAYLLLAFLLAMRGGSKRSSLIDEREPQG